MLCSCYPNTNCRQMFRLLYSLENSIENKYVERTIPGQYVYIFVNRWRVTFLLIDGVLAANQLNPTLYYEAMFDKNVFDNNCLFSICKKDFTS